MTKNLKFEKLLKDFNSGIKSGSQSKLAKELGIVSQSVNQWLSGKTVPSEENIVKMTKIFKKSQKELENIFNLNDNNDKISLLQEEIKKIKEELKLRDELIEFLREENKKLKNKIKV